ncbi:MAG TPA: ATP-binding protein [Anaerolineae bacterium]|nr:ATP-binding protein [Anaerolineae bacterium]HQI84551.1 ATP-binding protein [Anaerolineae bacterium]
MRASATIQDTRSQRRYIPLATRLFILFSVAAVLPLTVSGVFGLTSNYNAQRRQVEALQQESAANIANRIDAYLEQIEAEMELTVGKWTAQTEASLPLLLRALLTFNRGFETLTLVDWTGQEIAKVSRYTLFTAQDLGNRAAAPDFVVVSQGQRYLGPVSLSQFEEPLVTLAIPVKDVRQDVVGALVAEVNLKFMWDVIAQVKIGTGGYAYVVDREGRLIAHRDASEVLQGQTLRHLAGVRAALQGQATTSWYAGLEKANVIGSYCPLRRADWFVLVESPHQEALANVYQTGILNLVALAATLGLAFLLGGYMVRSIVRPMKRLQEGVRLIGGGDLAYHIDLASRDEMGDLADAFNGMAAQLQQTLQGLEQHVTELKQAEAEREKLIANLEAQNAELERFAYTLSHDLKTPLITIGGFIGFLEKDTLNGDVEQVQRDMTHIQKAVARMQQLLDELLELSRIGRRVNPPQRISLSELAHQAAANLAAQLTARGVQVDIAPELPTVIGDPPRLREVFENLLGNAAKFMGEQPHPQVEVGARQTANETIFYVRDNGIGIEPQYHDKVFGLFEKLNPQSEGTGVGLAIVKRIIELHGGRIWVESAGAGHGSTFCFTLSTPAPVGQDLQDARPVNPVRNHHV